MPILPYEAERRISPSRTCDGVPFVKRRAAASPLYARVRERHSFNRDNNGTRPGSSRADESVFRCVQPNPTLGIPDLPSSQIRELGAGTYGEREPLKMLRVAALVFASSAALPLRATRPSRAAPF